ncbi:hypothetical protein [Ferrimonas gelatinilytica]|uniref:Uncharacterized protein n=1 Tax=Ferrimonas gelatinilytica TaxID=1255257 RepID=A0ABP9RTW8_9GAMM
MRGLAALLMLIALPGLCLEPGRFVDVWQRLPEDPQGILRDFAQPASDPTLESERLLLRMHAQWQLDKDYDALPEQFARLKQRDLTPVQRGRLLLAEGNYLGAVNSQYDTALTLFDSANLLLLGMVEPEALRLHTEVLATQGSLLAYLRRNDEAIEVLKQAQKKALLANDRRQLALIKRDLGRAYRFLEELDPAMSEFQAALALADAVPAPDFPVKMTIEIARVFKALGQHDAAISTANSAAQEAERIGKPYQLALALSELGYNYEALENISRALHYHMLALDQLQQLDSTIGVARTRLDIARTYIDAEQTDKARVHLERATSVFEQRQHQRYLFQAHYQQARLQLAQGNAAQALSVATPLLAQIDERTSANAHRDLLLLLAEANHQNGTHEQGWHQLRKAFEIQAESPGKKRTASDANALQLRQQLAQQGQRQRQLEAELSRYRQTRVAGLTTILCLLVILGLVLHRQRRLTSRYWRAAAAATEDPVTGLNNRTGLITALANQSPATLVLLRFGSLPDCELTLGQRAHQQARRTLSQQLANLAGVSHLAEIAPGLFALQLDPKCPLEPWFERLIDEARGWPTLTRFLHQPITLGALPHPFQPGVMFQLSPHATLELAQMALQSATLTAKQCEQSLYVQLKPLALNAPMLNPDHLYASAAKCIHSGVIRCQSNYQGELEMAQETLPEAGQSATHPTRRDPVEAT